MDPTRPHAEKVGDQSGEYKSNVKFTTEMPTAAVILTSVRSVCEYILQRMVAIQEAR